MALLLPPRKEYSPSLISSNLISTGEVAVVFSAFGGVTDTLISISKLALEGNQQYKTTLIDSREASPGSRA